MSAAFSLLFSHLGAAECDYRAARAVELVTQGHLNPAGVLILGAGDRLEGVFVCQPTAGAGALVWPPIVRTAQPEVAEDALVQAGCAWLAGQGTRLAQCLLATNEMNLAPPLLRQGFVHVTGLTYLRHDLRPGLLPATPTHHLRFHPYDADHPERFHRTLERTYEQSLDCPEVNGLRSVAEVIRGHQAHGHHDPSWWWLAELDGDPVGVLLLTEASLGEWEVGYMGVVPQARRRGVGSAMLTQALTRVQAIGGVQVVLCVDDRNRPARQLYVQLGFEPHDHREVLLNTRIGLSLSQSGLNG
ncbi:MAG: GNAT family N-acetyltransferase [Gemmataceae bacterium]